MHKNPLWLGLLAIVGAATVWFAGKASWQIYSYNALSEKTTPNAIMLTVKKKSRNSYYPLARYSYEVDGKEYQGVHDLVSLAYFRETFLEDDLPKIQSQRKWTVWYASSNPNWSTLEKSFPYKSIMYAIVMVGLLGYFFWLGFHVSEKN